MLKTVRDACTPHEMVFNASMSEQIEDLAQLINDAADGKEFYQKNYITAGMQQLFEMGLKRLAGRSDQAIFQLTQAMGGGKTHAMVAFGLIVKDEQLRKSLMPELAQLNPFKNANIVAFYGRKNPQHFLWGEIAAQLGKADQFRKFWQNGAKAPDEQDWVKLIGDEPTLILLDELPPYFDYAYTQHVGSGTLAQVATYALSNLFSAALQLKRLCIVVSNLSGTYEGASKHLRKAIKNVEQEANRQAKPITPVELGGDEIYQILKKRLFSKLPTEDEIEEVAQAFGKSINEAVKSKYIAKSTEQIAAEIHGAYPFHPSIKDIIALFRNNESYRQTRGLMQFVAKLIVAVWNRDINDVYLIGLQHLQLNDTEMRDEINQICDLRGAIASDIAANGSAHAETIDAQMNSDAGSQVGNLLLSASLSTAVDAVKGMTVQRLLECLIAPNRSVAEFQDSFKHLKSEAWYLHKDRSGAYYFSNVENLTKRLQTESERASQPKIDKEIRRRLENIFKPSRKNAYQDLQALPLLDDIKLSGPRMLLILSPDTQNPPKAAQSFFETIIEKNNLCILTGDGSDIINLEEKTRVLYAIAKLQNELPVNHSHQEELGEKMEQAELDFNATVTATFNRIYYPMRKGLVAINLSMKFQGNNFNGEEQIENALAGTGASKLVLDIEKDISSLLSKAEDLLWPMNQKQVPWRDVKHRAISNARWSWLPNKGMEILRKHAGQRGRWRYTEDGYIEKGPFSQLKTSVDIQERAYDEKTGKAILEITAKYAGNNAQVYYDATAQVSPDSKRLKDNKLETDASKLWFLAIDPSGKHEMGTPVPWTNTLTITHQPREGLGKRTVALHVVPRGIIKYTLSGANPTEGNAYTQPIEISNEEVTIYCYAVDQGVETKRNFTIPPAGGKKIKLDKTKPATLKKRVSAQGTEKTYTLLTKIKETKSQLTGAKIEVGSGNQNATLRFGSKSLVSVENVENIIKILRQALGDDIAEVNLWISEIMFTTGHDLEQFIKDRNISISANEVEQ